MKPRVYADTSVIGGCEDQEFAEHSIRLLDGFVRSERVLVSWNFEHIVNLERIHGYHAVNLRKGYPMIEIRTPPEVLSDD